MKCEKCHTPHEGNYGTGRFCSSSCARSYSTAKNREEINSKVSDKLKGHKPSQKSIEKSREHRAIYSKNYLMAMLAADFSTLTPYAQRNRVIIEQEFKCSFCKLDKWFGHPITLEVDHEDGNNKNNARENLRALCPNCHSLTPTWRGKTNGGTSLRESRLAVFRGWLEELKE